jgi:hypothetical protein
MDDAHFQALAAGAGEDQGTVNIPLYTTNSHWVVLTLCRHPREPAKCLVVLCHTWGYSAIRIRCKCRWSRRSLHCTDSYCGKTRSYGAVLDFTSRVRNSPGKPEAVSGAAIQFEKSGTNQGVVSVEWSVSGAEKKKGSLAVQVV